MEKSNLEEIYKNIRLSNLIQEKQDIPKWQLDLIKEIWKLYADQGKPGVGEFTDDKVTQIIQTITNKYKNDITKEIISDTENGTE